MLTFTAVLMLSGCTSYDNFRRTFIDKETEDSNVIYVGVFEPESGQYKKVGKEEIKGIGYELLSSFSEPYEEKGFFTKLFSK